MTFDMSKQGSRVLYVNFQQIGDGVVETESEQLFSFSHLIENTNNYVCEIQRFRIPLQTVPMQDAIQNAVTLRSKSASSDIFINTQVTFSLYEWMLQLSNSTAQFNIILTSDGRIQILDFDLSAFSIELNPLISDIFDLPLLIDGAGVSNIIGGSPVWDRFDQAFKINIEALNGLLNLQQEIIDTNVFTTILTDFIIPSTHSLSVTNTLGAPLTNQITFVYPQREDLEFNASSNGRKINFRGSAPIQNIKVRVTVIYRDGTRHPIVIPRNGVFNLKLAFFKKPDA